jgi:hypothetical protein
MAPRRMAPRAGAPLEPRAPDGARAIIPTLPPAAPARAPHDRRGLGTGRAAQRRDRAEEVPRAPARVAALAHLAPPGGDGDGGAPPAPRRLPAPRHPLAPLAPLPTAGGDLAPRLRGPTPAPRGSQALRGGRLGARRRLWARLPGRSKERCEAVPVPRGVGQRQVAPRCGVGLGAGQRLSHAASAPSTPPAPAPGRPPPPPAAFHDGDFRGSGKCIFLDDEHIHRFLASGTFIEKFQPLEVHEQ